MTQTQEIKTRPSLAVGERGLEFRTFDECYRFCEMIVASGFAPKGMNAAQVMGAVQFGREVGIPPMQALTGIAVVNGRPSVFGALALSIVQSHPEYEGMEEAIQGDGEKMEAVVTLRRRGKPAATKTYSVDDAKRAKLWMRKTHDGKDTPWVTSPEDMLLWRARHRAIDALFSDAMHGLLPAEVARDYPEPAPAAAPGTRGPVRMLPSLTDMLAARREPGNQATVVSDPAPKAANGEGARKALVIEIGELAGRMREVGLDVDSYLPTMWEGYHPDALATLRDDMVNRIEEANAR